VALREVLVRLGIDVDRQGAQRATGLVDNLRSGVGELARFFSVGVVAAGFGQMISLASDAAEVASKLAATYGEMTDSVTDNAVQIAQATGRSKLELKRAVADLGAIIKPMTGSTKAAADMSTGLAQLAIDLASFNNTTDEVALESLRSGIVGQSEPMLKFGVVMLQANLQAFALSKGIRKNLKDMTQAEKVALRYSFIMEQTRDAQGDAVRTAAGLANMMRRLRSMLLDLAADFGTEFLPVLEDRVLPALVDTIGALRKGMFNALTITRRALDAVLRPLQSAATRFGGLQRIVDRLGGGMEILAAVFTALAVTAVAAGVKMAASWAIGLAPILLMIAALAAVSAAIGLIVEDLEVMGEGGESVFGTLLQGFQQLVDELGSYPAAVAEMLATAVEFWARYFQDVLGISDRFIERIRNNIANMFTLEGIFAATPIGQVVSEESFLNIVLDEIKQKRLLALPPSPGPASGTIIDQSDTTWVVEIDASGHEDPAGVAGAVGDEMEDLIERRDRHAMNAFTTE
jgi:hypothetical protein